MADRAFERVTTLVPVGVGLALVGYSIPGFLFGPMIDRMADRHGRGRLLPLGLGLGAVAAAALIVDAPLALAVVAATVLPLGYVAPSVCETPGRSLRGEGRG